MKIDVISCHPDFTKLAVGFSIMSKALKNNFIEFNCHDLRDFSTDKHKKIDDYQYGGGSGMIICIEPVVNCIEYLKKKNNCNHVLYMSADGEILNQKISNYYCTVDSMIIICGHYKGIDQRIRDYYVTHEISIGNYVLSGGELPAAIFIDSVVRLIPGVLSDGSCALEDSFQNNRIEAGLYTKPRDFRGYKVPDVLLSGNHKKIEDWKNIESIKNTKRKRPSLLEID
jgi:tRNA (guanine37-N1)-methyltransferase